MSATARSASRKRKLEDECRVFNDRWTDDYFSVSCKGKAVCLICRDTVSTLKEFNLKRHHESRHKDYSMFQGLVRTNEVNSLEKNLFLQQNVFKTRVEESSSAVRASYHVAKCIAESGRPFTDGEFVKKCLGNVVEEMCPDKLSCINNVSLSASTRRVEDIGEQLYT